MHSLSHSLAHRGPGASRARSRWQPYANNITSATASRSPATYLHTPASSVSSSSPSSAQVSPITHIDRPRKNPCQPTNPPASQGCYLREAQKNKYVTRLVDQAVKSLGEIWHPEDIPQVFRTQSRTLFGASSNDGTTPPCDMPLFSNSFSTRNTQLPSPISPTTHPSPLTASPVALLAPAPHDSARSNHLIPIRCFVHEVLRRSRTSTGVLQTALCYLEAVRMKIPELLRKEKANTSTTEYATAEDLTSRIVVASPEECAAEGALENPFIHAPFPIAFDTVHIPTLPLAPLTAPQTELLHDVSPDGPLPQPIVNSRGFASPLAPLPPIPSPLLCPRRTFLACLILASKFLQDRSYSNKAWAKLAGLPPREIGRCERALGEALEWRLWVGKGPAPTSVPAVNCHRAVARCRSESTLQLPTCPAPATPAYMYIQHSTARSCASTQSGLRRSSTMPNIGVDDNGSGFAYGGSSRSAVGHDGFMLSACAAPTVLVEEPAPTFEEPAGCSVDSDNFTPFELRFRNRFLTARDTISPSLSTPTLVYSPMSTASSASSDDGDRQLTDVPFSGRVDMRAEFEAKATGSFDSLAHLGHGIAGVKLAPIAEHTVSRPPVLPPISEAVFNPVLLERSVHGSMGGCMEVDNLSVYPESRYV